MKNNECKGEMFMDEFLTVSNSRALMEFAGVPSFILTEDIDDDSTAGDIIIGGGDSDYYPVIIKKNESLALLFNFYARKRKKIFLNKIRKEHKVSLDPHEFDRIVENIVHQRLQASASTDFSFPWGGDDWYIAVNIALDEGYKSSRYMSIEKWMILQITRYAISTGFMNIKDYQYDYNENIIVDIFLNILHSEGVDDLL